MYMTQYALDQCLPVAGPSRALSESKHDWARADQGPVQSKGHGQAEASRYLQLGHDAQQQHPVAWPAGCGRAGCLTDHAPRLLALKITGYKTLTRLRRMMPHATLIGS